MRLYAKNDRCYAFVVFLLTFVIGTVVVGTVPSSAQEQAFRYESSIVAYEKKSTETPLPENCTMFVGSSTWRLWGDLLEKDFAEFNAVNRGFGGATIPDLLHVMHRIITPHKPARIVFFCGGNDIARGASSEETLKNFEKFLAQLWSESPQTEVFFVSGTRAPVRAMFQEQSVKFDDLVRELVGKTFRLHYIDTFPTIAGADGRGDEKYFLEDRLHMNREGQERWIPVITAALREANPPESTWQKTEWEPIFKGIDTATGQADSPRLMRVYAIRIDTKAEGIEFYSTPRANEDFADNVTETIRQTTPLFLEQHNLQVAINANFYSPFNVITVTTAGPSNLSGLAVSQGQLVSRNEKNRPAFLVFKDKRVAIVDVEDDSNPPAEVETAVAGNRVIVRGGTVLPQSDEAVHPRTAVGISNEGRYVYFVVIDGRQQKHSVGSTYVETGQWLVQFGAWEGLNLDGGGSTTMVVRSSEGKAKALNVPVGRGIPNTFRYNGNNLGVRAMSLPL